MRLPRYLRCPGPWLLAYAAACATTLYLLSNPFTPNSIAVDTTFTPPAPYGATMLVVPPVPCPLADVLATTFEALRLDAERAGLPDVSLRTGCTLHNGRLATHYCILATCAGQPYTTAPAQGYGPTLAQAEEAFYAALSEWKTGAYEADPCRYADQAD